jgi:hypothetical protein
MKYSYRFLSIAGVVLFLLAASLQGFSQNGDPPPPPGEHGQTGNQPPGGGAPIGSGLLVLAMMGAGYGAVKYYNRRKNTLAE